MKKSLYFVCSIFFCLISIKCFAQSAGPRINVGNDYVFRLEPLDNGSAYPDDPTPLVLTCSGDQMLSWKVDESIEEYYYKVERNVTMSGKHYATLSLSEPILDDTGNFTCYDNLDRSDTRYIYIYDGEHGFVKDSTLRKMDVVIGDTVELDCRTTLPSTKVSVYIGDRKLEAPTVTIDKFGKVFFKHVNSLGPQYTCRSSYDNTNLTFVFNTIRPNKLQKPTVQGYDNSNYAMGYDFSLFCYVPASDTNQKFIWQAPNPKAELNQETYRRSGDNKLQSKLTVKSASLRDSGTYICNVKRDKQSSSNKIQIKVEARITPYVAFKKDLILDILYIKEHEPFVWSLQFKGFPNKLQYELFDPENKKITNKKDEVSTEYSFEEGLITLTINKISAAVNFGQYFAVLKGPNGARDEVSTIVVVNATPKIEFSELAPLFPSGKSVSLSANILSFSLEQPIPNITWTLYDNCPNGVGSCDINTGKLLENVLTSQIKENIKNRLRSNVTLTPNTTAFITCEVRNVFGPNSTSAYLNVSDQSHPFVLRVASEIGVIPITTYSPKSPDEFQVIEGDNVQIQCFSLKFYYRNLKLPSVENANCSTELSWGRCGSLRPVAANDAGAYECSTVDRQTSREVRVNLQLVVLEKLRPTLRLKSNVSTSGAVVSPIVAKPFFITCYVDGRPTPTITWYKDGIEIENISNFVDGERILLLENKQRLEFKFAQTENSGQYMCKAVNRVGSIHPYVAVKVKGAGLSTLSIIFVALAVTFILSLCLIVVCLILRIKKESKLRNELRQNRLYLFEKGNIGDLNKECTIDEQADLLPYDKAFEVEKERIILGKQLGSGAFGRVMQADVDGLEEEGKSTRVAVKMCLDGTDMAHLRALTLELKIMVHLGKHLNIVNLMGAYTANMSKGDLWILVEYCKYGNLLKHIQRHRSRYVNQVDAITGLIDTHRSTSFSIGKPTSPTSLARHNSTASQIPSVDADGYLETRQASHSFSGHGTPFARDTSVNSSLRSTGGTCRPGLYVGNPQYATVGLFQDPVKPGQQPNCLDGPRSPSVMSESVDPYTRFGRTPKAESVASDDVADHLTVNTEMTMVVSSPQPPPFSPASTTSGDMFFDSQGNPAFESACGVPGIATPMSTTDLVCWAWQVANGMDYLTKRKVLHGDLAARNLLLAENNVVKISDFGLSRDIYKNDVYMKKGEEIMPIKWMAPEAIQQKVFSIQSDVWAYGITLWEMFTLGTTPYPGIPLNQDFPVALERGMRMEQPKYANEQIYDIMIGCWQQNPMQRPSFIKMADMLSELLSLESKENYLAMNNVLAKKNQEWLEFKDDYLTMVTSPDFENIQPLDEPHDMGLSYIPMQDIQENTADGMRDSSQGLGYLDMRSVRSSPPLPDSIFSPRPETADIKSQDIFTFSEKEIPLSGDQQSPTETLNLLGEDSPDSSSDLYHKDGHQLNNNISKLNSLNQNSPQAMYQNLDSFKIDPTTPSEKSEQCDVISPEVQYMNLSNVTNHNTINVV